MEFLIALLISLSSLGLIGHDVVDRVSQAPTGHGHDEIGAGIVNPGPGNGQGDQREMLCPKCFDMGNGQGGNAGNKKYLHINGEFKTIKDFH